MIENHSILNNIVTVMLITVLSKFASFLTNIIIAMYLGIGTEADAYTMLNGIHNVLYPMLSVGIWKVFLPEYNKKIVTGGIIEAGKYANKLISWFLIVSLFVVLLFWFNSNNIISFMAPGFDDYTKLLSADLFKLSSPQYFFILMAAFYSVMLQSNNKFMASQIREVVTYIPLILFFILFYEKIGINACAYGLILGAIVRFCVQLPFVDWGYKFKFDFSGFKSDVIPFTKKMPNVLFSTSVSQLNLLIVNILASGLGIGIVASLGYATRLNHVFNGLLSSAIGVVIYPLIAKCVSSNDKAKITEILSSSLCFIAFTIIPISIFCNLFADEIITIVYKRGMFDLSAVEMTGSIFAIFALGMVFTGLLDIFFNFYYAFGNTMIPLFASLVLVIVNSTVGPLLSKWYGAIGLAMSNVIAVMLGIATLSTFIKKYISFPYKYVSIELLKVLIASVVSWIMTKVLGNYFVVNGSILKVFVFSIPFFVLYFFVLYLIKSRLLKDYYSILRKKYLDYKQKYGKKYWY